MLLEDEAAQGAIEAAFRIHRAWGPGLLESAYAFAMTVELRRLGHAVEREVAVPVEWAGVRVDCAYRIDLLVDDCLLVELKSVEKTAAVHRKQVITYLKLTNRRLGLLINFGEPYLKNGIARLANGMP